MAEWHKKPCRLAITEFSVEIVKRTGCVDERSATIEEVVVTLEWHVRSREELALDADCCRARTSRESCRSLPSEL